MKKNHNNIFTFLEGGEKMKKLLCLFALIFTLSIVGCSSDNSIVSPNVDNNIKQAPAVPTEGDPDGMGTGNGATGGDPGGMGDGLGGPSGP